MIDSTQLGNLLSTYCMVLCVGFAFCTILEFISFGIFKAFRLLDIKK